MSEENLSDLLERSADRHNVGSPPLDQMLSRSRSARKRRAGFKTLAASVVIGCLIAGTTWLFNPGDSASPADLSPLGVVDLEGEWVLTALTDANGNALLGSKPRPMNRKMHLFFQNDRLRAVVNCSNVTAAYAQSGSRDLSFSNIESDVALNGAICNPPPPLAERLRDVRHVSEEGGRLQLHAEDWMIIAVLERVDATPTVAAIATYEPTGTFNEALTSGTLAVRAGCLVLTNGADAALIVFNSRNTSLDGQTLNTTDQRGNDVSVQIGEKVSFAGGGGPVTDRPGLSIPAACDGSAKGEAFYTHGTARGTGTPTADIAIWSLAPNQTLTEDSTEFTALVTRAGCNGGVTGEVLEPSIDFSDGKVSVSFTVTHSGGGTCPSNDSVPVTVRLPEPIGSRALVDGQCVNPGASTRPLCQAGQGVQWSGE